MKFHDCNLKAIHTMHIHIHKHCETGGQTCFGMDARASLTVTSSYTTLISFTVTSISCFAFRLRFKRFNNNTYCNDEWSYYTISKRTFLLHVQCPAIAIRSASALHLLVHHLSPWVFEIYLSEPQDGYTTVNSIRHGTPCVSAHLSVS